ncbi:fructose-1,6-bisphosphatase [Skermanella stibiiresistens SB22]|uniref:Fructose-1,6-bisphosphatase n=1 Tax=Skermanella stibiiresistens SB22 TaxID=1385369 RepID=W9H2Y6_9PROT|nr:inositol monophosphatase [Skermanella stibiiresistens]EWY40565.1 fructose-1,6-bisphosphatase [Skermanella stibiiresistens SB22]
MLDLDRVSGLIRRTAEEKILPRFRNLGAGDVTEKAPGDPVTIADTEAEIMLGELLGAAYPNTLVIGEELVSKDPSALDALLGDKPVWIIDPVDGTLNFSEGVPVFGTILAYVVGGEIRAGWLHDPINDVTVAATLGGGAWSEGRRLEGDRTTPLSQSIGSAYWTAADWLEPDPTLLKSGIIGEIRNHRCSALDYIDLALGKRQFVLSTGSKPWDHAAGILVTREIGGAASFLDGMEYNLTRLDGRVLAASSRQSLDAIRAVF